MELIVLILLTLFTILFRQKPRKSNFFRLDKNETSKKKYFTYWQNKQTGYWKILILSLMIGFTWLLRVQYGFAIMAVVSLDKGIPVMLPPKNDVQSNGEIKERNILNVLINSSDQLLVEEEVMDIKQLKVFAKKFITNRGKDPEMSESPQKAIISLKTDRGTSYEMYVKVRDTLQLAYNELRAEHLGLTLEEFSKIQGNLKLPENKELYDKAKDEYPVMISDAAPSG